MRSRSSIFILFFSFGVLLYSLADSYGGIRSAKIDLDTYETMFLIVCNLVCSLPLCGIALLIRKRVPLMEDMEHWTGFMTGCFVLFVFDQLSWLLAISGQKLPFALAMFALFSVFYLRTVFRADTLKKRIMLVCLVFAAFSAKTNIMVSSPKDKDEDSRPSVVLLSIDALQYAALQDKDLSKLESFRYLSQNAASLSNIYSVSPNPKSATESMLTARFPHHISREEPQQYQSTSLIFRQNRYKTAAFLGDVHYAENAILSDSFDIYDPGSEWIRGWSLGIWGRLFPQRRVDRSAGKTTDRAMKWLEQQERPYFLWVQYHEPMPSFSPPIEWDNHFYDGDSFERHNPDCLERVDIQLHPLAVNRCDREWLKGQYKGEIASLDRELLRLITWVQSKPNTLLVVVGTTGLRLDSGTTWFDVGDTIDDASLHIPSFWLFPDIIVSKTISSSVRSIDVLPTIFSLIDMPHDASFDGNSVVEVFYDMQIDHRIQAVLENEDEIIFGTRIDGIWKQNKRKR